MKTIVSIHPIDKLITMSNKIVVNAPVAPRPVHVFAELKVLLQQVVLVMGSLQITPASSECPQLCLPTPL